jgi:integrase
MIRRIPMASVKKRPDGQWRARYRDDAGKEHARHFARKVDAQRWLDEVTASVVTGAYVDPKAGRVTFAEYFAGWAQRQVWESGTDRAVRLAAGSVTFGDVPLASLRRSHVERWVKAMQAAPRGEGRPPGLAPGTIRTRVNNVRGVLRAAVRDRVIASDPSDGITLPRVRRPEVAMALPATAQVRALLAAAPDQWGAFVALCAFAGLRLGEAAALRVQDVDFLRRTLAVARQVQRAGGGTVEIRPPKYGSERTVYLADGLVTILSAHVAEHCPGDDPGRWLFGFGGDVPPHQNTVGYWWHKARAAAGCAAVKLHDLRHYYASGLIAAGCDVVTVQRALGHASATVTLGTYAHLWPTAEDRTRAAAASMLAETLSAADSPRTSGQA